MAPSATEREKLPSKSVIVPSCVPCTNTVTPMIGSPLLSDTTPFTYVGYKEVVLPAKAIMSVLMQEDNELLEEVVVTGYTSQRKADLTGAVSAISAKDLEKQQENNPMKALQGKVPGMNISADGNPSGTATVPFDVPSSSIDAPMMGSPVAASTTTPVAVTCA